MEQLIAEGEQWIPGLGGTGLPHELCHLLVQEHRPAVPLGGHALCAALLGSSSPKGVVSLLHCDGGGCLAQDPELLNWAHQQASLCAAHPCPGDGWCWACQ